LSEYIKELRNEDKLKERVGVILGGALVGLVLGLKRKSKVTKAVYALAGASAVASVIYPEEAKVIGLQVYAVLKECFEFIYQFLTASKHSCFLIKEYERPCKLSAHRD
jgi:hypothetical protein